jgi:hypothetical protein
VRRGQLQATLAGGQYLLLGEDMLAWLRAGRAAVEQRRHRVGRRPTAGPRRKIVGHD